MRAIFARVTNADDEAFVRDELTITTRKDSAPWPFTAMAVGFGTGVVFCVAEPYVDWAREHAPKTHHRAFYLGFQLEQEARRRGQSLNAGPPTLGWALASMPEEQPPPSGVRIERVSGEWLREWQPKNVFHNALGTQGQTHRTFRNLFAYVAFDAGDDPVAVAGVYQTAGLWEIGVDVRREHRARGLAESVVRAATRAIVDEGRTPFYECPVTNIRSQRTALASGFMPVCSVALVYEAGLGLGEAGSA
jgi:hypothetical protein